MNSTLKAFVIAALMGVVPLLLSAKACRSTEYTVRSVTSPMALVR